MDRADIAQYTYYTLTALSIKVPTAVKKVLTTLQIVQFVIGASFAFAHLFIAYSIPVSAPYTFSLADLTSVASEATADASSAVSVATATASAGVASWLKKLAFRAAGREGLAENVVNEQGETFGVDAFHAAEDLKTREEIRYRDELQWIHCTDTSGQAFAILLNCMYLAPLTFLFVKFFIQAYSQRLERRRSSTGYNIEQSAKDAFHSVARQAVDAIGDMHGSGERDIASTEEAFKSSEKSAKEEANSTNKSPATGAESAQDEPNGGTGAAEKPSGHATEPGEESAEQSSTSETAASTEKPSEHSAESTEESLEQPSTSETAASSEKPSEHAAESGEESTEPMAEGGNLADDKTELHESGLQ